MWLAIGVGLASIFLGFRVAVHTFRLAVLLGRDEGFEAGYEHAWNGTDDAIAMREESDAEARRWRAECEDDWLAT